MNRPGGRGRRRDGRQPVNGGNIAASYARYSSDHQDESSITQQQRKCREEAQRNGHDLQTEFEFKDEAMSGTRIDRAGFQAMLAAARERRFNVLYFENLSRLAREFLISISTLKELVYVHKIRIISTSEGIDSDRAGWELMAIFRSVQHAEFISALRSAVLRGQEEAILNDWSVGDWCLGYGSEPIPGSEANRRGRNRKPRKRVIINEQHARWVRQIFDWFVNQRRPPAWIARELTRMKAPKDHRATTTTWRHQYVTALLRNRKYIGIWPWGEKTNVRNPLTGQVTQEDRPPEEAAKYERERPHLRLVDDETYFKAQGMLDANDAKYAGTRQDNGRLRGSTKDLQNPRHLLQGVVRCGACNSVFQVAGAHGKYLKCAGSPTGECDVHAFLRRDLAEQMILEAVGERILRNLPWRAAVLEAAQAAWRQRQSTHPAEEQEVQQRLAAVEQKIAKLMDDYEDVKRDPDLRQRLSERQRERDELKRRLDQLRREQDHSPTPPTAEWVDEKLRSLQEVLSGGGPAAAVALRKLVGAVVVTEVTPTDRKQKYFRGTFTLRTAAVLTTAGVSTGAASIEPPGEPIVIDFTGQPPWAAVADDVQQMFDEGLLFEEMAARLKCPRSWPAKALAWFRLRRGLPPLDGRSVRGRLAKPSEAERLADRAKTLWDEGRLVHEIASELGCCRDSAAAAIEHWFTSRGLPVPDGRTRRKSLDRKSAPGNDGSTPAADNEAA